MHLSLSSNPCWLEPHDAFLTHFEHGRGVPLMAADGAYFYRALLSGVPGVREDNVKKIDAT